MNYFPVLLRRRLRSFISHPLETNLQVVYSLELLNEMEYSVAPKLLEARNACLDSSSSSALNSSWTSSYVFSLIKSVDEPASDFKVFCFQSLAQTRLLLTYDTIIEVAP